MSFNAVVFDMDGVLLDSMSSDEWKWDAVRKVVRSKGVEADKIDKKTLGAILGDKGYKECIKACNNLGLSPKKIWTEVAQETTLRRREKIQEEEIELFPNAQEIIENLHSQDIKMGVISNAPEGAVEATIEEFGLKKYMHFYMGVRSFEDLQARKPNPNHLEIAKIEIKRNPILYVGDAESDVIAANRANLKSAWLNREHVDGDIRPDFTIESLEELKKIASE
ncbi:MAG: phosphoglycolate phosphatase [Candidatus Nanohaloarchaea archaeon]|jgi:phosphoglycolate phosphatase